MKWYEKSKNIFFIEDVLSNKDYDELYDEFNPQYNHWVFNKSENHGNSPLFGNLVDSRDEFSIGVNFQMINIGTKINFLAKKILKRNLEMVRINTNIQFFGQESDFHVDCGEDQNWWTFLVFLSDGWDTTWGGEFIVQTNDRDYIGLPFIPNCGVLFDSKLSHKGSAPNRFCIRERKSVAFAFEEL